MMTKAVLFALACLLAFAASQSCNPANPDPVTQCPHQVCKIPKCRSDTYECYYVNNQCNNTCPLFEGGKADFMFIIDDSGSMGDEIQAVASGISAFAANLTARGVDSQFMVITAGKGEPRLAQPWTTNLAELDAKLQYIASNANNGWEPLMEAFQIAMNEAPSGNYRFPRYPTTDGPTVTDPATTAFRTDAIKNVIFLTDEDSDIPFNAGNRLCPGFPGGYTENYPDTGKICDADTEHTAQMAVDNDVRVFLLSNPDSPGGSLEGGRREYGDPAGTIQVQDTNFENFDAAATVINYENAGNTRNLQYQILQRGGISRIYNVIFIQDPNFVTKFYTSILEGVKLCKPCEVHRCDPILDQCLVSQLCDDNDPCTTDSCANGVCIFSPITCPQDACTEYRCDSSTGTCSVAVPKGTCPRASSPCKIMTCDPAQPNPCVEEDKVCPESGDICVVTSCDEMSGGCRSDLLVDVNLPAAPDICKGCDPPCCNNGSCVNGKCRCVNGWTGTRCLNPPELEGNCTGFCPENNTCRYENPQVGPDQNCSSFELTVVCIPPVPVEPPQTLQRSPSPPVSTRNVAIAAGVLTALIVAVVVAILAALWYMKRTLGQIADLNAMKNPSDAQNNPLYEETGGWKDNVLAA